MFDKSIAGVANGHVGGMGGFGGGVTQIVMGTFLFPLFRDVIYDGDSEKAWRIVCVIPAVVAAATGILVVMTSEDCPEGNYKTLKKEGRMVEVSVAASFREGATDFNTWFLFFQYASCVGVEITMNNFCATYFVDKFELKTSTASAIASIVGFMSIVARGWGGFLSDKFMTKMGMRGRIIWQSVSIITLGLLIFAVASVNNLGLATFFLTVLSIFLYAAQGSTYGIVPYVNPSAPGAVAGIVGAGGPIGGVLFGLGFRQIENVKHAFYFMASIVVLSGLSCLFVTIKGHRGLLFRKDVVLPPTLTAPVVVGMAQDSGEQEQDGGTP